MPIGILKYKQDDGSIVELQPAGYVKTETYTAGQAEQNTRIEEVSIVAVKANADIGSWETDHPRQTISECATSIENAVEAADAKADAADTKATNNAAKNVEQDNKLETISNVVTDHTNELNRIKKLYAFDTIANMCKSLKTVPMNLSSFPVTSDSFITFIPAVDGRSLAKLSISGAGFECPIPYPCSCTESETEFASHVLCSFTVSFSVPDGDNTRIQNANFSTWVTLDGTVEWLEAIRSLRGKFTLATNPTSIVINYGAVPENATVIGVSMVLEF